MTAQKFRNRLFPSLTDLAQRKGWRHLAMLAALFDLGTASIGAHAQNVISNSYFDTDVSAWTTSPGAEWSHDANAIVDSNDHGGSLRILADNTGEHATQCIPVDPEATYLFDIHVLRDFNDWPNPEPADWAYGMGFFRGPDCDRSNSDPVGIGEVVFVPATDFGWQQTAFPINFAGTQANHLLLTLGAVASPEPPQPVYIYFDAITLIRDTIFKSDFDVPQS